MGSDLIFGFVLESSILNLIDRDDGTINKESNLRFGEQAIKSVQEQEIQKMEIIPEIYY